MALVSVKTLLEDAERCGYAVPAFNAYNVESVVSILSTAHKMRSPVIVQAYSRLFQSYDAANVAACVKAMADQMDIPIALHLDHGASEYDVIRALRYGFTGVMIDGSKLEYEKNVELTARIVQWGGYVNVPVEGELGHVGLAADAIDTQTYTEPDEAKDFVERTGVSLLAVMVGSAHGIYREEPKLDIDRIARIKEAAGIPLVLHGGSGIPAGEIKAAVAAGIRKINVATDICQVFYEGFRHLGAEDEMYGKPLDVFLCASKEKVDELVAERIDWFGSAGRV